MDKIITDFDDTGEEIDFKKVFSELKEKVRRMRENPTRPNEWDFWNVIVAE